MNKIFASVLVALSIGLVGCHKTPAYVGTYKLVMNDAAKKMAAFGDAAQKAFAQPGQKKVDVTDMFSKMTLTLTEDGKATMPDPTGANKPADTTYTVNGNSITVKSGGPGKDMTLTFDEKAGTLTMDAGGMSMVFQKQ